LTAILGQCPYYLDTFIQLLLQGQATKERLFFGSLVGGDDDWNDRQYDGRCPDHPKAYRRPSPHITEDMVHHKASFIALRPPTS
jgi:hypothetical protein